MVRRALFMRRLASAGLTAVLTACATAPVHAESLHQSLATLYNNSHDLMAARYAAENSNEIFNQVAANALPQVSSTWQTTYARSYNEILEDAGDFNATGSLQGGVSLSQTFSPVISGGVVQTRKSIEAGWVAYDQTEQQLLLAGIQTYLAVIRSQSGTSLQSGNVTLLENQLQAAQARYDAGIGTTTQIAEVAASLAEARAGIQQASGDLIISNAVYRQVFGVEPTGVMLPPLPASMPATLAEARSVAMKNNPSVQLAMVQLQEAEAKRKVTAAELQPSYQLGLNAQRSTDILNGGGTTNFSTSFGLSMPLYGNRQVSNSKLRQDEIAIRRLREQLSAAQASVDQQVIAAWHQFQTAQAVGQARSSQITASELSLRGAVAESDAGTKTGTDVIAAQQSLTAAQVAASNARVDVVQGAYNLVAAMGLLSARDLQLPVRYYVPEREFENRKLNNLATLLYDR